MTETPFMVNEKERTELSLTKGTKISSGNHTLDLVAKSDKIGRLIFNGLNLQCFFIED